MYIISLEYFALLIEWYEASTDDPIPSARAQSEKSDDTTWSQEPLPSLTTGYPSPGNAVSFPLNFMELRPLPLQVLQRFGIWQSILI